MIGFVDIAGASGKQYRFRSATIEAMPASAGNALVITGPPAKSNVIACLVAVDLAQAAPALHGAVAQNRGARVFVRLNVARTVREAEHQDIIEACRPDLVLDDFN